MFGTRMVRTRAESEQRMKKYRGPRSRGATRRSYESARRGRSGGTSGPRGIVIDPL
ncbi:Hypothetical protein A7982_08853 [Minicystis rosea]|nr:Hypothetical protein A7982_08853 [Minicystis rosea]